MTTASPGSDAAAPTRIGDKPFSVVLVHGAFVDASGWRSVYDLLTEDGYEVLVVQNPTATLDGDVAGVLELIGRATRPVILVGHSYGGAVITVAGQDPSVVGLVYLAAFVPDVGESVFQLASTPSPGAEPAPLLPPEDGHIRVDPAAFLKAFAADLDAGTARFMAAAQLPWGLEALQAQIPTAAWTTKPAHYLVATQDRMIPPDAQRGMAARARASVAEVESSHAVMLSHPQAVADAIVQAAGAFATPRAAASASR